jgi:hypothetical protein
MSGFAKNVLMVSVLVTMGLSANASADCIEAPSLLNGTRVFACVECEETDSGACVSYLTTGCLQETSPGELANVSCDAVICPRSRSNCVGEYSGSYPFGGLEGDRLWCAGDVRLTCSRGSWKE